MSAPDAVCYDPHCAWEHGHVGPCRVLRKTFKVEVEVTGEDAPDGYSNETLADNIRDRAFEAVQVESGLAVVVMTVAPVPEQQLVWVGTVTTEQQPYGQPAVYVSDTEDGLLRLVALQNGASNDDEAADLVDWFQYRGMVFDYRSHYVE